MTRMRPRLARCAQCDGHYLPRYRWHRVCNTCYAWARIGHHVGRLAAHLPAVRP
ncbi:MAG: hypothetical protein H0W33_05025 [Gammaproteobacteria bacterium]|nr:hypothetical protein [Gammaproteobacteria bacterium]